MALKEGSFCFILTSFETLGMGLESTNEQNFNDGSAFAATERAWYSQNDLRLS
jgi:hypothetical protein